MEFSGTKEKKRKGASILPAIARAFGPTFLFGAILKLVNDCLTFVNPKILELLIGNYLKILIVNNGVSLYISSEAG